MYKIIYYKHRNRPLLQNHPRKGALNEFKA